MSGGSPYAVMLLVVIFFCRNWVLVNAKNIIQTQRQMPKMALIRTSLEGEYLVLDAPGMPTMKTNIDIEDDENGKLMIE